MVTGEATSSPVEATGEDVFRRLLQPYMVPVSFPLSPARI